MGRKSLHTKEEKLQAVLDFKSGKRSRVELCKELGLHESGKCLYHWISIYDDYGEDAFNPKEFNKKYSKELKEIAIREYLAGKGSYKTIARKYSISSSSVLAKWVLLYKEELEKENNGTVKKQKKYKKDNMIKKLRQENRELKQQIILNEKEKNLMNTLKVIEKTVSRNGKHKPKYVTIKELHESENYSINWMCQALNVTRAGYYKWLNRTESVLDAKPSYYQYLL